MHRRSSPDASRPRRLLHVATTDITLDLLLGPQLIAFQEHGFEVHTASAPGPHADRIIQRGIQHHALNSATRSFSLWRDLTAFGELFRLINRLQPDIVHTHNPKPGVYGRVAARAAKVPLVVNTQHGLYAQDSDPLRRRAPVWALERFAAAFSDFELVQNTEDLERLANLGVQRSKLVLLGNGIDLDRFRVPTPAERRSAQSRFKADGRINVGVVARLVAEKGFAYLLEAAAQIRSSHPDVRFHIAGPTDEAKSDSLAQSQIDEARHHGMRFLGMVDDIHEFYWAMDMFVLPSLREGFPRSAMEATASGLPVIATDIRGCRDAVDHLKTGILVKPRSGKELARAIELLAVNPEIGSQFASAGLAKAKGEFDDRRVIARTLVAYGALRTEPARSIGEQNFQL
jgi:glycosyltransferase involved in cell wall biosynthesis